jgi:hypothetical protein
MGCLTNKHAKSPKLYLQNVTTGTFQDETDEKVVYGLTHPINSWNPIWVQVREKLKVTILCYTIP